MLKKGCEDIQNSFEPEWTNSLITGNRCSSILSQVTLISLLSMMFKSMLVLTVSWKLGYIQLAGVSSYPTFPYPSVLRLPPQSIIESGGSSHPQPFWNPIGKPSLKFISIDQLSWIWRNSFFQGYLFPGQWDIVIEWLFYFMGELCNEIHEIDVLQILLKQQYQYISYSGHIPVLLPSLLLNLDPI